MDRDSSIKIMSPAFLIVPIVIIIISFVGIIGVSVSSAANETENLSNCLYTQSDYEIDTNDNFNTVDYCSNTESTESATLPFALLAIIYIVFPIAFILYVVWIWSYSKGVDKVTDSKLSFALSLIILIVVPDGIDILIIQEYFNKLNPISETANQASISNNINNPAIDTPANTSSNTPTDTPNINNPPTTPPIQ